MNYQLGSNIPRHNVFVSYHHDNDQVYRNQFEQLFSLSHNIMVSKSVQIGEIDPYLSTERIRQKIRDEYLRDSTVTIVLIGSETWKRKHVDWEIGSSIRETQYSSRSGLLGILLPSYSDNDSWGDYNKYSIPPRLSSNVDCGFATIHKWSNSPSEVQRWIHEAYERRNRNIPNNSYESFANNRSGNRWY